MSKFIDLTGQRFGFWVVQRRASNSKSGKIKWTCLCECGKEKNITANSLRTGNSTSCGCNHTPDLINQVFGNLTVCELYMPQIPNGKRNWICKCICGELVIANTYRLRNKLITSCGCESRATSNQSIELKQKNTELMNKSSELINKNNELIKEQLKLMVHMSQELEIFKKKYSFK